MWEGKRDFTVEVVQAMFGKPKDKVKRETRKLDVCDSGIALGLGLPPHMKQKE